MNPNTDQNNQNKNEIHFKIFFINHHQNQDFNNNDKH